MFRLKTLAGALALALILPVAAFAADTGSANFARYVSLGDSLTAGFMSGSLLRNNQLGSYPLLIWQQATGSTAGFEQPLITDPGIPAILELKSLSPLLIAPKASGTGTLANPLITRPYNNLGVPGARVHDVVATVSGGLYDPILQSFSPVLKGKTALQEAVALQPTFVTLWIGNNDVLAAATSGRVIEGVTLTPVAQFEADFKTIVSTIGATGAKMAIANIPDVAGIPFVNTISRFIVNPATNQPVLINGQPVAIIGPNGPLGANDKVLLTASSELAKGFGIPVQLGGNGQPLADQYILDANEISTINARVAAYNGIIASVANSAGAALVDANGVFRDIAAHGVNVGGITFTRNFLTGGIFSYDGVHPTAFGYAYIANVFIDTINAKFGGEIPEANYAPYMFASASGASSAVAPEEIGGFYGLSHAAIRNLFWALNIDNAQGTKQKPTRRGGHK